VPVAASPAAPNLCDAAGPRGDASTRWVCGARHGLRNRDLALRVDASVTRPRGVASPA
jgi:hypothetical protein